MNRFAGWPRSMNPRIEEIFLDALDLEDLGARRSLVDQRVAELADPAEAETVRAAVLDMLGADEAAGNDDFLGQGFMAGADSAEETASSDARFEILAKHRQGGLGEVFIALDRQLGREVAIKQIKTDWKNHDEAQGRFVREAEVTGRLEHPGIVPVYAMGTWTDGSPYYAMRFVQGRTLRESIRSLHFGAPEAEPPDRPQARPAIDRFQFRRLLSCFVDVCNTISYAHSRGILHRDIKPSNIMVGPYGETLVVDWGLAKRLDHVAFESESFNEDLSLMTDDSRSGSSDDSSHTRVGGRVGTPQYMSPEQAAGRINRIDVRTDVYLLGSTLYEILCGLAPHRGDSVERIVDQIQTQPPPDPREHFHDIPPALVAICRRAMTVEPAMRYPTAEAVAADVERWMADQPVAEYRETVMERAARWTRNHRAAATSAFVATILLAMGSVLGTLFYNAQQNERRRMEQDRSAKAAELLVQQQKRRAESEQRQTEIRTLAERADAFSIQEMQDSRFASALGVVHEALNSIDDGTGFPQLRERLNRRREQLQRIVEFYRQAEICERRNIQSRDIHAMVACVRGLKALGVYDKTDWWIHLPVDGLSAVQIDRLRWDVYQQWMLLDAMLVKTIGVRLSGDDEMGSTASLFGSLRRFTRTDLGKPEAAAGLVVSDRLDGFRLSQAARWYRKAAEFRLGLGSRLLGNELGDPTNAVDSQSLGVLCLIAHLDPKFEIFFRDYREGEPLANALNLFSGSSSLRPDHYWSQMCLAQVHYLAATEPSIGRAEADRHLEAATRACERCIALSPEGPFAYADRSSISRTRAQRILGDESLPPARRVAMSQALYQLSLQDAQTADRLGESEPWIGWQSGLARREAGRIEAAIDRWWQTSLQTFSLVDSDDAALIRDDDLRGRAEVGQWLENDSNPSADARRQGLLTAIRMNQGRWDDAQAILDRWPSRAAWVPQMHWLAVANDLHHERFEAAEAKLAETNIDDSFDPITSSLLTHASARCREADRDYAQAERRYRAALDRVTTDDHRTAQYLGIARCQAAQAEWEAAAESLERAMELDPACNIKRALRPVARIYNAAKTGDAICPEGITPDQYVAGLKQFIADALQRAKAPIVDLPSDWRMDPLPPLPRTACLLDGGFELRTTQYWGTWRSLQVAEKTAANPAGSSPTSLVSDARWTETEKHSGESSLRIMGRRRGVPDSGADRSGPSDRSEAIDATDNASGDRRAIGSMMQSFPVVPGQLYTVECWYRTDEAAEHAVEIRMNRQTVFRSPEGTHGWQRGTGFFQAASAPESADGSPIRFVPAEISIQCLGEGTVWLDDLRVFVGS